MPVSTIISLCQKRKNDYGLKILWVPVVVYLVVFFLLNPHLFSLFSSHFYFIGGDGYQNVWNIWWVNKSVCTFGKLPWFTDFLHYPFGTTLIGQTLNPFNCFVGIFLLKFLSIVQVYNAIVIFSFVMGGVTAFWLCRKIMRSYYGSLVGGAIFTFSSFHFMHSYSHLQLVSLEWLPLFILLWIGFCEMPNIRKGVFASLALFLVILCDYYYFFYSVITGFFFYIWMAKQKRDYFFLFRKSTFPSLLGFLVPTLLTSGVFVAALVYSDLKDPLLGSHASRDFSMDLFSPFVWGYYWRFRDLVEPLWRPLSTSVNEASVYVGLSAIALALYAWRKKSKYQMLYLSFLCFTALFFAVMSLRAESPYRRQGNRLGPKLNIMGHTDVNLLLMPYAFLWLIFPPWRLSGVPLRMMIMVQLMVAIMAAGGIRAILGSTSRKKHGVIIAVIIILIIDFLPTPMLVTAPKFPKYVDTLKNLPEGAVLDIASPAAVSLYYQTIHQKKMAFGYISRVPSSVDRADQILAKMILDGKWEQLAREYHFRYIVKGNRSADVLVQNLKKGTMLAEIDDARKIYSDDGVSIYRF